jgi:hypothetical protein
MIPNSAAMMRVAPDNMVKVGGSEKSNHPINIVQELAVDCLPPGFNSFWPGAFGLLKNAGATISTFSRIETQYQKS